MANWRDRAGLQVVPRAVLKPRAKELRVWVVQLWCKKSAEKMWFCMTSVTVIRERAGSVLHGGPSEEQARQRPFCVPWISSWDQNLPSLCAAELGVAEGTEAETRTGCTGIPGWSSCSRNFCWMLFEVWAGWKMFLLSLSCLDLKFLSPSLPFLSCRLFCWHRTKCIDPANIFFVNQLRVKPFLVFYKQDVFIGGERRGSDAPAFLIEDK